MEGKTNEQAEVQERKKRDQECKQPSQGNPHQVKHKRQQGPKRSKPKSGDMTASQTGLTQYGFGPIPVGGTQWGPTKERQRPLRDVEEPNWETRSKLTVTVDLLPTPGRESGVEGQDSVEAPMSTTSQDYLVTLGDEIRRTEVVQCSSQQNYKTSGQPYLDLTRDTEPELPRNMRTPHPSDSDGEAATPQELRETRWAQDARDLGEMEYIRRYYADKLGMVSCLEKYMGLREGS